MAESLDEAHEELLLSVIRDYGGKLVLSGRNREILSGKGLPRRDLRATIDRLLYDDEIVVSSDGGNVTLELPRQQRV